MKVGIISFAHSHAVHYATYMNKRCDMALVGIWDEDEQRGKKMAEAFKCAFFSNLASLLKTNIEAVIVCSESTQRKAHVIQAAKAQKHILCEQPMATHIEHAQRMIKVCAAENVMFQIAYPIRFTATVQNVKRLIKSGTIGDVLAISGTNQGKLPKSFLKNQAMRGGGATVNRLGDIADLISWLLNDDIKSVYAELDTRFYDMEVDDSSLVFLEFDSGVIASMDTSWSRPNVYPASTDVVIKIVGTKGNVWLDVFKADTTFYNGTEKRIQQDACFEPMYGELLKDFKRSIDKKRQPDINGYEGLRILEVIQGAYESNRKRETVFL